MKNDRGECCAPFISKNYWKHILEYARTNFGWFGDFSFLVKFCLMRTRNTRILSKCLWANLILNTSIWSSKYSRKRLRYQFSNPRTINMTSGPRLTFYNTFALNLIFSPSGAPWRTTEESAAHHSFLISIVHSTLLCRSLWDARRAENQI